jgi:hypothetical protein
VRRYLLLAVVAAIVHTGAQAAGAQGLKEGAASGRDENGAILVRAWRISEPINVDGRLDETVYRDISPVTEFIQSLPKQGAPTTERTEAWVLYDEDNIYVACRCHDSRPDRIIANDMRHDSNNLSQHDSFGVAFDTFFDGRNGVQFYITAAGGMREGSVTDERFSVDWNGVWDGRSTRFEDGWITEMVVPFKTLRYGSGGEQKWHIQLRRHVASKGEMTFVTPLNPQWGFGGMTHYSAAATLVDLEAPPASSNFEIKPYAMSRLTTDRLSRPAVNNDVDPDWGVDVKYGLTESLTADFSYNTDFAQVEVDEAQVNLTRFSLSFPERRDFFLESQGLFQFGTGGGGDVGGDMVPNIFYTRRIGLTGARAIPVIAGGRVSGKAGLWSIGALNMATEKDEAAGVALTDFTVLRLRRDILRRSNVGGLYTRRSVSTVGPGANDVWGVDANFAFYQNVYFSGYLSGSRNDGRSGDDLSYRAQFNYTADRYGLAIDRLVVEPNFNPEVGLIRRENFRRNLARARFSPRTTNNRLVRKWTYEGSLDYITDNKNVLESREANGTFRIDFHNTDSVSVQYQRLYELLVQPFRVSRDVRIPVGGYDFDNLVVSYTAGAQYRLSGTSSFETGSFYNGDKKTVSLRGRLELTNQLGLEPNISLNWVDLPEGSFTDTVIGARSVFTMTPRMFVGALVQYQSSNSSLSTNLRFRWEYQPGSELFVVYTEGRSTLPPRGTDLDNRGFVVKINRLFRF